jgi:selenocysteine lyase/cysteine desulfurase
VDARRLRAQFPVLARLAYLNAGRDGPVPSRAAQAASEELERQASEGRTVDHASRRQRLQVTQRTAYAALLGCEPADVALTTSASEGIGRAIAGLPLGRGDEVITSDEEHPGLLGPLQAVRDLRGAKIRQVPLSEVADAVAPATRLVACSQVSWVTGAVAPAALAEVEVPILLDGAQGIGAVPVDVHALGCDIYAGSSHKWLCGPDGAGMLYVSLAIRERLAVDDRHFNTFKDPYAALDAPLHEDARRYDTAALSAEASAFAVASLGLLDEAGWDRMYERARSLAAWLADRLRERGHDVRPRGDTTLVTWRCGEAAPINRRLAGDGVIVRDIPGHGLLRASVGAWNDESDLERLLEALPSPSRQ